MRLRLLRRRLTVSSPRMAIRSHTPWPLRWLLAAVVLVAVAGLFSLSALQQLWRGDRRELAVALAAR